MRSPDSPIIIDDDETESEPDAPTSIETVSATYENTLYARKLLIPALAMRAGVYNRWTKEIDRQLESGNGLLVELSSPSMPALLALLQKYHDKINLRVSISYLPSKGLKQFETYLRTHSKWEGRISYHLPKPYIYGPVTGKRGSSVVEAKQGSSASSHAPQTSLQPATKKRTVVTSSTSGNQVMESKQALSQSLIYAIKQSSLSWVKALVKTHQATLNAVDEYGDTALRYAAGNPQGAAIVAYLIGKGFSVDHPNKQKETPLMWAARYNNVAMVKVLVETHQATLNVVGENGSSVLCHAACNSKGADIVAYFIQKGLSVNHQNKTERTPLIWAAVHNNTDVIKALVEIHQADIKAVDVNGLNALDHAKPNTDTAIYLQGLGLKRFVESSSEAKSSAGSSSSSSQVNPTPAQSTAEQRLQKKVEELEKKLDDKAQQCFALIKKYNAQEETLASFKIEIKNMFNRLKERTLTVLNLPELKMLRAKIKILEKKMDYMAQLGIKVGKESDTQKEALNNLTEKNKNLEVDLQQSRQLTAQSITLLNHTQSQLLAQQQFQSLGHNGSVGVLPRMALFSRLSVGAISRQSGSNSLPLSSIPLALPAPLRGTGGGSSDQPQVESKHTLPLSPHQK